MKKYFLIVLCISAMLIGGCGTQMSLSNTMANIREKQKITVVEAKEPEYIIPQTGTDSYGIPWDGERIDWSQYQLEDTFKGALTQFTARTTAKVSEGDIGNLCYSPVSFYYALSLAALGASGQAEQELLTLLGVENKDVLKEQCDKLYHLLYADTDASKLQLANSIWSTYEQGNDAITLKENYIKNVKEHLFASIYNVERTQTENEINQWISEKTNGLIQKTSSGNPVTWSVALINTIYYKDQWIHPFLEAMTEDGEFTKSDGSKLQCSFMNGENNTSVKETDTFWQASLPLQDSEMFFVLPKAGFYAKQLMQSEQVLNQILSQEEDTQICHVTWKIPKFSYETSFNNLAEKVKELGVVTPFERSDGFMDMTDAPLFIDQIIQESKITVDEKGVEAAAYTEIMQDSAVLPERNLSMNLDRPFLYGIKKNGNVLFIGICEEPNSSNLDENQKLIESQNTNPVIAENSSIANYIPEQWNEVYMYGKEGKCIEVGDAYRQELRNIIQSVTISPIIYTDINELPKDYEGSITIIGADGNVESIYLTETGGMIGHGNGYGSYFKVSENICSSLNQLFEKIEAVNGTIEAPTI